MPKDEQGWRRLLRQEDQQQVEEELAELPLFQDASPAMLKMLSELVLTKSFSEGQDIVHQGSAASSMLLVRHGIVRIFCCGKEVGKLEPGRYFGETVLLELENKWQVSLQAEVLCSLGEITCEDFQSVLEAFPTEARWYRSILEANTAFVSDGTLRQPCEIFTGLSTAAILGLDHVLVRRLYFPGERFLEEGQEGDELYILVRGQVAIEIADRTVRQESVSLQTTAESSKNVEVDKHENQLRRKHTNPKLNTTMSQHPVCFGELALLGIQSIRSASVRAQLVSQVRILYRSVFLKKLEENADALDTEHINTFIEKRYSGQQQFAASATTLKQVPIFKELGCSVGFLDFLAQHLEDRIYLLGQQIVIENCSDDRSMYILNSGRAKVLQGGRLVATLGDGSVFGEVVLFGISAKRSSTVVCDTLCHTQVLHQNVVIRGLELFPSERQKVLMIAFARTAGDAERADREKAMESASANSLSMPEAERPRLSAQPDDLKAIELKVVMKAVKSSAFFSGLSQAFIEALGAVSTNRIYMPGDLVIEEGSHGDSMFIMVSGSAAVTCTDNAESNPNPLADLTAVSKSRVGMLSAGSISGELAMLGVSQTRSATIEAETICCMWEISHDAAMPIIERFPNTRQQFEKVIVHHLQHTVPTLIDSLPLFKGFERKFRMLLGLYCEPSAYFSGQQIFAEAQVGDGLYIVNLGKAVLERKGIVIKSYSSGSHFNSNIMLGLGVGCLCTLTAVQTCHVVVISRPSYLQALEHYPAQRSAQQILRTQYIAHEEFKAQIQRLVMRTAIWKRAMNTSPRPDSESGNSVRLTELQQLRRSFKMWLKHAELFRKYRTACEKQREVTDLWIVKKKEAIARRKDKDRQKTNAQAGKLQKKKRKRREDDIQEHDGHINAIALPPISPRPPSTELDTPCLATVPPDGVPPTMSGETTNPGRLPTTPGKPPTAPGRPPTTSGRPPSTPVRPGGTPLKLPATPGRLQSPDDCAMSLKLVNDKMVPQSRFKELSSIYLNWRQKLNGATVREK